jgi:NAD(P)-dependent dehydrogenase (short-subunit alcohol dehydrogenase family)
VLVTGASRGIGRATAELLLAAGAQVALSARDAEALASVASQHDGTVVLVADMADTAAAEALAERAATALGGLDALICAAGVAQHAAVGEISARWFERQLTVNLTASFLLAQRAASLMGAGGSIAFVASTLAFHPAPLTAAYAASKGGLVAATRSLALELAERGIRVNAVAPGVVDTDMARALRPGSTDVAAQLEMLRRLHPLARLGQPRDVAEALRYLLLADYVTGTVLTIDGGLSLGSDRP